MTCNLNHPVFFKYTLLRANFVRERGRGVRIEHDIDIRANSATKYGAKVMADMMMYRPYLTRLF